MKNFKVRASKNVKASKQSNRRPVKAARVYTDGFGSYTPWSGAKDTWDNLERFDCLDALEQFIDEAYYSDEAGEGVINETELNDLLWFEPETVYEAVGLYYNPDTDEVSDEPFEDEDDYDEEYYDVEESTRIRNRNHVTASKRSNAKKK